MTQFSVKNGFHPNEVSTYDTLLISASHAASAMLAFCFTGRNPNNKTWHDLFVF
jgi:hypothetical protein